MGSREGMQLRRDREGQQIVSARQKIGALSGDPPIGLILMTLRATAIAARVIGIHFPVAVVALVKVASKERRSTVLDIGQRLLLNRRQAISPFLAKRFTVEADDVSHLPHEDLWIRGRS